MTRLPSTWRFASQPLPLGYTPRYPLRRSHVAQQSIVQEWQGFIALLTPAKVDMVTSKSLFTCHKFNK